MPGLCGHCRQKKVEKHKKKELGFAVTSPVLFLLENKIIKNAQKNKKIHNERKQIDKMKNNQYNILTYQISGNRASKMKL